MSHHPSCPGFSPPGRIDYDVDSRALAVNMSSLRLGSKRIEVVVRELMMDKNGGLLVSLDLAVEIDG